MGPSLPASRIVIIMPNWLGDGVMATPFLRSLHALYPAAHIAAVARPLVAPVVEGLPWVHEIRTYRKGEDAAISKWMRLQKFDLGVLLPNSFRSAWMLFRGKVPRRLGYARGGRSFLLTDRVQAMPRTPQRREADHQKSKAIQAAGGGDLSVGSAFEPVPTIDYYLQLARYLGAPPTASKSMQMAITPREREDAATALAALGIPPDHPYFVLVPGANFGSSKCWMPDRFAQVADHLASGQLIDSLPTAPRIILAGSPAEIPIIDAILAASRYKDRLTSLAHLNGGKGASIGALKEIVRRSSLMVCNDTGPRHFAAAFDVPVVTLFGPTDPVWAETYSRRERIVRIDVPCGPCQLKTCPIDHRCMRGISTDMVAAAIDTLRSDRPAAPAAAPASVAVSSRGEGGAT